MSWSKRLAEWIKAQPWIYWIVSVAALILVPVITLINMIAPALLLIPATAFVLGFWGTVKLTKKELSWMQAYLPVVSMFFIAAALFLLLFASGELALSNGFDLLYTLIALVPLAANILCFFIGERIRAKRLGIKRKRPSLRQWGVLGCILFGTAVFCMTVGYFRTMNTIMLDDDDVQARNMVDACFAGDNESGYGWRYENGWSSVNLAPYYVENEDNLLAKLDEPSDFVIAEDLPVLDGAEAAYPVYSAFANACYENIAEIQRTAKENDTARPIAFTNTVEAYKSLIAGDVDIFFGAKPSQAQLAHAEEAGVELEMTPISKEAFVFFVSGENPVDGLTSGQIRDIYSGKTNNWLFLGGGLRTILAFQRPENSGSQTMMQYFMGDVPLREPLEAEYNASMFGVIRDVAEYRNDAASIGYSFRYYASQMVFEDADGIKFLELDGVYPSEENIRTGSYPMTTELYAISLKGNENPNVKPFLEWMTGEQGRRLVRNTGYVTEP